VSRFSSIHIVFPVVLFGITSFSTPSFSQDHVLREQSSTEASSSTPAKAEAPIASDPVDSLRPLVLIRAFDKKLFVLSPDSDEGGFDEDDAALARDAWGWRSGETHEVHPRLLNIVYRAMCRFKSDSVLITSGYRPGRKSSMHAWGRAVDLHIPGAPYKKLAQHLRTEGFVGVGFYPRTKGVHVDVRVKSFFWVSWEPRGKRWRERSILPKLAGQMDRDALARGVSPPEALPTIGVKARQRKAWNRRQAQKRRRAARARAARKRRKVASSNAKRRPTGTASQPRRQTKKVKGRTSVKSREPVR
jgi:hypothetical protein